jgi:serine/threonine protein kinase
MGTIHYMAPEQINGKPRPASDQYALGIIAYEWLSGNRPFNASLPIQIAMQHLTETPPPLTGKVSLEVEQVIMKAISKKPEDRYDSIEAFARAIEDAANRATQPRQSIQARPVAQPAPPRQPILARPITGNSTARPLTNDPKAAYHQGLQHLLNKKYVDAIAAFILAQANGSSYDILYNLGRAYRQYGQSLKDSDKKLADEYLKLATEKLEEALRVKADALDAYFQLGICYRDLALYPLAVSTFKKGSRAGPARPGHLLSTWHVCRRARL